MIAAKDTKLMGLNDKIKKCESTSKNRFRFNLHIKITSIYLIIKQSSFGLMTDIAIIIIKTFGVILPEIIKANIKKN